VSLLKFVQSIAQIAPGIRSGRRFFDLPRSLAQQGIAELENTPDSHIRLCYVRLFAPKQCV